MSMRERLNIGQFKNLQYSKFLISEARAYSYHELKFISIIYFFQFLFAFAVAGLPV